MSFENEVLKKKYLHEGEEKRGDLCDRIANIILKERGVELSEKIYEIMINKRWSPAGSILANLGTGKSLSNCYVVPIEEDSLEGIFECMKKMARTFSWRGGCGFDISILRPKGCIVNNAAKYSTGSVSFLPMISDMVQTIGQKNRRGACICTIDISHPDVIDFIKCKSEPDEVFGKDVFNSVPNNVSGMNLSVKIPDSFMEAVANNDDWDLVYDGTIYNTIKARDLFRLIAEKCWASGDPGVLFWDRILEQSTTGFVEGGKPYSCNPCVTGDTLILTREGYKPIEELVGKSVIIWNGFEWSEVEPRVTGENQEILEIEFSNGSVLKCTPYHKFILEDGRRVEAKDISIGQKLIKWEYPIIEGYKSVDRKLAYTKGFFCGDGAEYKNGKKNILLYNDKINLLPYLVYSSVSHYNNRVMLSNRNYKGFSKNFVPNVDWTIQSRLDYLAGLIDSDGTLNDRGGSIAISSINKDFLFRVQRMLHTLGVHSTVTLLKTAQTKLMPDGRGGKSEYNTKESYRLIISSYYIQKLVELGLETHRVNINVANPNRNAGRFIFVKSIKKAEKAKKVYCFTEPNNHSGVFNGIMTGQCGEQPLMKWGNCLLSSFNLLAYIDKETKQFNRERFIRDIPWVVEFMDLMIDLNHHPLPEQNEQDKKFRKIGIGITGLGDALAAMGIKYSTQKAWEFARNVMETITVQGFRTSIELAKKYGPAPILESDEKREDFIDQPFIQERPELYEFASDILKYGCRNTAITSIAPTGTLSIILGNVTSGCEPLYEREYYRTSRVTGKTVKIKHPPMEEYNIPPENYETAMEIHWEDRLKMQAALQEWTTDSISSTVNLPASATVEDIEQIYMRAWEFGLKGVTIYRDGSKDTQVLSHDKDNNKITTSTKKLPEVMQADRHIVYYNKSKTYFNVTRDDSGNPVEVFVSVPTSAGLDANGEFDSFRYLSTLSNWTLIARLISLCLRNGISLEKVLKQINKSKFIISDLPSLLYRVLSKYVSTDALPGTNKCPDCGATLVAEGGCLNCHNCGWSKCG